MGGYSISDALAHNNGPGNPTPSPRPYASRRRRKWPSLLALVVLGGAGAGGYLVWRHLEASGSANGQFAAPEDVELPANPADPIATATYLNGPDGAIIRQLLIATAPLSANVDSATCEQVIAGLEATATPADVLTAASGIPDQPTAEMAVAHLDAVKRTLAGCLAGVAPVSSDEVLFTSGVLTRRIEELT